MSRQTTMKQVVIMVDFPVSGEGSLGEGISQAAAVVQDALVRQELPATWTDCEPVRVERWTSPQDELGLRLDGRRPPSELRRMLAACCQLSLPLRSVLLGTDLGLGTVSLLADQGIRAVRSAIHPGHSLPKPICQELWHFATSLSLPNAAGRFNFWRVPNLLKRELAVPGPLVVTIDLAAASQNETTSRRQLDQVLRRLGRLQGQGSVKVTTLGQLALGLIAQRQTTPARSILRPAA